MHSKKRRCLSDLNVDIASEARSSYGREEDRQRR